jgi:hypothetical protein
LNITISIPISIFDSRIHNWIPWYQVEEYSFRYTNCTCSSSKSCYLVDSLEKPSELGGQREGIVIRNAGSFDNTDFKDNVMKWVRAGHVTTTSHWTRNWKKSKVNR